MEKETRLIPVKSFFLLSANISLNIYDISTSRLASVDIGAFLDNKVGGGGGEGICVKLAT